MQKLCYLGSVFIWLFGGYLQFDLKPHETQKRKDQNQTETTPLEFALLENGFCLLTPHRGNWGPCLQLGGFGS